MLLYESKGICIGPKPKLGVGGIVHTMGPDPFGNCMPLPRLLPRALCELFVIGFGCQLKIAAVEILDNCGI